MNGNPDLSIWNSILKGIISKSSGKYIVGQNLCFLRKRPQILAPVTFFWARLNGGVGFDLTWHFEP